MKIILAITLTALGMYLVFDPRHRVDKAQEAILSRFEEAFCHPNPSWPDEFRIGETAAASRTAIEAGLGPLAAAEFAKCWIIGK